MPTRNQILAAMQFDHIQAFLPLNTRGGQPYEITYQFAGNSQPGNAIWSYNGWTPFTNAQKNAVRAVLTQVETFLNVDFVEVRGDPDADLDFGRVNASGWAGQGGLWLQGSTNNPNYDGQVVFDRTFDLLGWEGTHVIVHEVGHALGLDHPFEGSVLPAAFENNHYTVMSYTSDPHSGVRNDSMMLYDILALQDIWGAASHANGNTVYNGRGNQDVRVVWDTGGIDTFNAATAANRVELDLRPGRFSTFGTYEDVAVAYGVRIENAIGSRYSDLIQGNRENNLLQGRNGHDRIIGDAGNDRIFGQGGNDVLIGGSGHDVLLGSVGRDALNGGTGNDAMRGQDGADTFVFRAGYDRDRILDFTDDVDRIRIIGEGTRAQVLAQADEVNGHVRFNFGDGDILIVLNTTINELRDDLIV